LDRLFSTRVVASLARRQQVWCLGDSHMRAFNRLRMPGAWFRVVPVRGATASGIRNPQSRTEALKTFRGVLHWARPWQHVIIGLGEVDCGFLIWHRAGREDLTVAEQLERTLDEYVGFLIEVRDRGFCTVTALSAPLPTVVDYREAWSNRVAHLRSEVTADIQARTELTVEFNTKLATRCREIGVRFADTARQQLDPATGLVYSHLVDPLGEDHHLRTGPYTEMVAVELRSLGFASDRGVR
jgi:hypothetical protein